MPEFRINLVAEEALEAKELIESIEFGLEFIGSEKPPNTLNELHKKSLRLHGLLGGQ